MECNKDNMEIINIKQFNDSINKYNQETNGEFQHFLTTCNTSSDNDSLKGGAFINKKLYRYFFVIFIFFVNSIISNAFFRESKHLPAFFFKEISMCIIYLLKMILINGCSLPIPIINDMCPLYKTLLIDFLNNLEIILIKFGTILKYGLFLYHRPLLINDIYRHSRIYYYFLNNPEFIDDIEYPINTEFIVNKNNYPPELIQKILSVFTISNNMGDITPNSTHKLIPINVKKMKYIGRIWLTNEMVEIDPDNIEDEDIDIEFVEVDKFITPEQTFVYLNPVCTRFYINIGYLSVNYIINDEAKNEMLRLLKDRPDTKNLLELLELKYNIPESFLRSLSHTLGYGYKSTMIKSPQGIINETKTKSSLGGKLTKTKSKKYKNVKKTKKSKRKTRKHYNEL